MCFPSFLQAWTNHQNLFLNRQNPLRASSSSSVVWKPFWVDTCAFHLFISQSRVTYWRPAAGQGSGWSRFLSFEVYKHNRSHSHCGKVISEFCSLTSSLPVSTDFKVWNEREWGVMISSSFSSVFTRLSSSPVWPHLGDSAPLSSGLLLQHLSDFILEFCLCCSVKDSERVK